MNKDELIEFLQENLTIEIDKDNDWYDTYIVVKLKLEDKEISESRIRFTEGKQENYY